MSPVDFPVDPKSNRNRSNKNSDHQGPPSVSWLLQKSASARAPALYLASLTQDVSRAFASIDECEHPAGMWLLTMYPKGRERQFVIYFPALESAKRAVELWVGQYWQSIEG